MKRTALLVVLALACLGAAPRASRAAPPVVVKPGDLGPWSIANVDPSLGEPSSAPTAAGTRGDLSDGPAPVPLGQGSYRQRLGRPEETQRLQTSLLNGRAVNAVSSLAYSTYVTARDGGNVAPNLQLLVDLNADGRFSVEHGDDVLTFEPMRQNGSQPGDPVPNQCAGVPGCAGLNRWQRWDGAAGGWWSLRAGTYGPPLVTLARYQSLNPGARLTTHEPSLRLSAGGGSAFWRGFDASIDRVTVDGLDYDFEAAFVLADCTTAADDVREVQGAVDRAPPGYGVRLRGACDFSTAAPHGGGLYSIQAAAVVLRSSGPGADLAIDGEPEATVSGSGTQAAFFVPPGSSNVSIRGLRFSNLGRPIVVAGSADVAVEDNRIAGGASMTSGVLAVSSNGPVTVSYGVAGEHSATYAASPALDRLRVNDNRISFDALGIASPSRHLVAIDVRQRATATIAGLRVERNVAWFATNELRSFDIQSVRVDGEAPLTDGATIANNLIGRPEDAEEPAPATSAGGRVGIFVRRVANARIEGNKVRSVLAATPVAAPGGGIVVSDVTDAVVSGNVVDTIVDASERDEDLGAIGVVDDLGVLFGETGGAPATTRVEVRDNVVGPAPNGAHRGILVDGSSWVDVTGNRVEHRTGPSIGLALPVDGPAGVAAFPLAVSASVVCGNTLRGSLDDPNEVSVGPVASSSFPGGGLIASNGECVDAGLAIVESGDSTRPAEAGATDTYTVALSRRPRADVIVAIDAGTQVTTSPSALTFTPSDWAIPQTVTVTAIQDSVSEGTHLQALVHEASSPDPGYHGVTASVLALVVDDDPGSIIVTETGTGTHLVEGGATDTYSIVLGSRPGADVRVTSLGGSQVAATPNVFTFTEANWAVPQVVTVRAIDDNLREGPHLASIFHRASSQDPNFDNIPIAGIVATIVDNDVPQPPVIQIPSANGRVGTTTLVVSGTGEPGATVDLAEGSAPLASAVVSSQGRWSTPALPFAEGPHTITASQVDRNGFRSATVSRTFVVDLTPPAAPVIVSPTEGQEIFDGFVTIRGTAEPNTTVVITEGARSWTTPVSAGGTWQTIILFALGPHTVVATVMDATGNLGASSPPRTFIVKIDKVPPDAPVVTSPADGAVVPRTRTGGGGETLPGFYVIGTTEPNASIEVWEGSQPLGTGTANSNGDFQVGMSLPESRTYTLSIRAVDQFQNRGPFAPSRIVHVDGDPPTVAVRRPPGQVLVVILPPGERVTAFGTASDAFGISRVSVRYTSLSGASVTRDATLCCERNGAVEWTDSATLGPGRYLVAATSYDLAGNASRVSSVTMIRL